MFNIKSGVYRYKINGPVNRTPNDPDRIRLQYEGNDKFGDKMSFIASFPPKTETILVSEDGKSEFVIKKVDLANKTIWVVPV